MFCSIMTMHDIATRLGNTTTGQLHVRSGIEIERVLKSLVDNSTPLSARLPDVIFLSKLVSFDPIERLVTVDYSDHKPANTALLAMKSVTFMANQHGAQFAFACSKPRHGMHMGQPAIRMSAPAILLAAEPRHNRVRGQVPGEANVECDLRMGLMENRLVLDVKGPTYERRHILSLSPFRGLIRDYFMICDSYYQAIRNSTPQQIEALDMGRRGLHNEASELLRTRLSGKIETDMDTARRLFTLICALHWRG